MVSLNSRSEKTFRLPTESEWDYAARIGGQNEKYSWSNTPDSVAWYGENNSSSTHGVGTKTPNGLGLYDMSGNVHGWCSDSYNKEYVTGTGNTPKEPLKWQYRMCRGGSWFLSQEIPVP